MNMVSLYFPKITYTVVHNPTPFLETFELKTLLDTTVKVYDFTEWSLNEIATRAVVHELENPDLVENVKIYNIDGYLLYLWPMLDVKPSLEPGGVFRWRNGVSMSLELPSEAKFFDKEGKEHRVAKYPDIVLRKLQELGVE